MNYSYYAYFLLLSFVSGMIAMWMVLKRHRARGAIELSIFLGALSFWSLTYALFWLVSDPVSKYNLINLTYLGAVIIPASFFIFSMRYTHNDNWLTPSVVTLFFIEPIITLVLLWTDPWHNLFFAGHRTITSSKFYAGGFFFWVNIIYSYVLLLIATIILVRDALRSKEYYRWQALVLIVGLLLPWLVNILGVFQVTDWLEMDLTPALFTVTGIVILYNYFWRDFLDIVPIARDMLVENLDDGLLLLDDQNRIVDFNPVAFNLMPAGATLAIGQPIEPVLAHLPAFVRAFLDVNQIDIEICLDEDPPTYLDLHIKPMYDPKGTLIGRLCTWKDVTARKRTELALQEANAQLRMRLEEIQSLQIQLREQAIRDDLTGAYNRRYFGETFARELARSERNRDALTLVIFDIDSFKAVNDKYGHVVGDSVLKELATLLSRYIRSNDILCRYGGEEFIILLPNMEVQTAYSRANGWRDLFATHRFLSNAHEPFFVTASFGLASYPRHGLTIDALVHAADEALYTAKRLGKNRIVIYNFES